MLSTHSHLLIKATPTLGIWQHQTIWWDLVFGTLNTFGSIPDWVRVSPYFSIVYGWPLGCSLITKVRSSAGLTDTSLVCFLLRAVEVQGTYLPCSKVPPTANFLETNSYPFLIHITFFIKKILTFSLFWCAVSNTRSSHANWFAGSVIFRVIVLGG